MQYARGLIWSLFLIAGCTSSTAQPVADGALPDAADHTDVWPWLTADGGSPPADTGPAAEAGTDALIPEADALGVSACSAAETAPLRRLTTAQYLRTVRELTGVGVSTAFPDPETRDGFDDRIEVQIASPLLVATWNQAAEEVVTAVLPKLAELTGCPGAIDDACARAFIGNFGRRAYRRPLTPGEIDDHLLVFTQVKALGDASDGIAAVLRVMLQSPSFLYRPEVGGHVAAGRMTPTPWETASRLSYFLWGNMPDAPLFAAAESGALGTPQQLAAQIQRMQLDSRARQGTNDFIRQWLSLDRVLTVQKEAGVYPAWSPALAAAMREEGYRFAQQVIFDGDGRLATLLTSTDGIVNAPLAQLYGVPFTGTDWKAVDLSAQHRLGLLTQGWFLAGRPGPAEGTIATRGVFVRERLLCQAVPPPPPGLDPPPPPPTPGTTGRERYQSQLGQPACAGCHSFIDPFGFPFESYDGIGAFRTIDNGKPIDASAEIMGTDDLDGRVTDGSDLIRRLGASKQVRDCVATRWYELAVGRSIDSNDCRTMEIERLFRAGTGNLRELVATIALDASRRARPASEVSSAISSPLIVQPMGRLQMQKLVLDLLGQQVVKLRQRLSLPDDQMRLDQHLAALRELEMRLSAKP